MGHGGGGVCYCLLTRSGSRLWQADGFSLWKWDWTFWTPLSPVITSTHSYICDWGVTWQANSVSVLSHSRKISVWISVGILSHCFLVTCCLFERQRFCPSAGGERKQLGEAAQGPQVVLSQGCSQSPRDTQHQAPRGLAQSVEQSPSSCAGFQTFVRWFCCFTNLCSLLILSFNVINDRKDIFDTIIGTKLKVDKWISRFWIK